MFQVLPRYPWPLGVMPFSSVATTVLLFLDRTRASDRCGRLSIRLTKALRILSTAQTAVQERESLIEPLRNGNVAVGILRVSQTFAIFIPQESRPRLRDGKRVVPAPKKRDRDDRRLRSRLRTDEGTKMTAGSQAACIRPEAAVETDPRWARVLARDRSADGLFFYYAATT